MTATVATPTEPRRQLLEEVATVVMGQSPPSSAYNTEGEGLPFFQGKAEFGALYPTAAKWCTAPRKIAEPGDVLMSVRAPVGPTNLATERCCIGRGLAAIRPREDIRSKWLLYAFRSMEQDIDALGTGTTFKAISGETLRQLSVPVALPAHQDSVIAEIEKQFSRLDEAVAALKRVKATLKRHRISVLSDAVSGGFPVVQLGDLIRDGGYGTSVKCSYDSSGIGVLRIPNISGGRIDASDLKRAPEEYSHSKNDLLTPGDLLIIRTNGSKSLIGRGAILLEPTEKPLLFASYLIRFRLKGSRTLWQWVMLALNSPATRAWIEAKAASSAGQHNVSLSLLRQLPVPLPDEAEQRARLEVVDRQDSLTGRIDAEVEVNLVRVERLRQSTLARAFFNT